MRIILLTFVFYVANTLSLCGQMADEIHSKKECFEILIDSAIDNKDFELIFNESKETFKLMYLTENSLTIIGNDNLINFVKYIGEYTGVMCIRNEIETEILNLRYHNSPSDYLDKIENLNDKLEILDNYLNLITANNFIHYNIQASSKTWLKSFHLYHDNDIFMFSKLNADRDYTGGFRFELTTDQFKMRLFDKFGNSGEFLSYQSVFFGGEGYTPYIRFTEDELNDRGIYYEIDNSTNFITNQSLDSIEIYMRSNQQLSDRPFASFQYVGRGKYRLHNDGFVRSESLFKLGIVGGVLGKNIQAIIHQDLTTGSQRVLNWEDQIAQGGRLAFNIDHKIDLSIFSAGCIFSNNDRIRSVIDSIPFDINIFIPFEASFGTVQTHFGAGLGISNKSFSNITGINDPKYFKSNTLGTLSNLWKNSYIGIEYNYRRVIHNSMLEGLGFINTFPDDPKDDEAITIYALDKNSVEKNLHKVQLHLGLRVKQTTIYYKHVRYINKEFNIDGVTPNYDEFTTSKWYGYGRIGFNFMI